MLFGFILSGTPPISGGNTPPLISVDYIIQYMSNAFRY